MEHLRRQSGAESRPERRHHASNGFSLIELLIVVAIILIIAAIAIPNMLRSKIAANQAAAVEDMRTIVTANCAYDTLYAKGFAAQLIFLGGTGPVTSINKAELIDPIVAKGTAAGYKFTYVAGPPNATGYIQSFILNADPLNPGTTGNQHYFVDESGVIRFSNQGPASASDSAIQ